MNLLWVMLVTLVSVGAGVSLCFYLLQQAREVPSTLWLLEHVLCPIVRILVLLIVVSQVYPVIDENTGSLDFWRVLAQQNQFSDMLNLLFAAGLLLSFLPVVSHPVIALPLQSMLALALVFRWQYADALPDLALFPSLSTLLKLLLYMLFAYFVTRELSVVLARAIDRRFHVEGSIRLVSDAIYLLLQIPVMLIYCGFLQAQLTRVATS